MQSNFNMDFILGLARPKSISEEVSSLTSPTISRPNVQFIDDREDKMLPDSSLSPSNNFGIDRTNDETKAKERFQFGTDKSVLGDNMKIVYDKSGRQFYVDERDLINSEEPNTNIPTSTKQFTFSTLSESQDNYQISPNQFDSSSKTVLNFEKFQNFLLASEIAFIEEKLNNLDEDISKLDNTPIDRYINCPKNLEYLESDQFIVEDLTQPISYSLPFDPIGTKNDNDRKLRLQQVMRRHVELKRSLYKYKKKLRQLDKSKFNKVDFSTKQSGKLPIPDYMMKQRDVSNELERISDHSSIRQLNFDSDDNCNFPSNMLKDTDVSDLSCTALSLAKEDENSNIIPYSNPNIKDEELSKGDPNETSDYFKKNIFSTILNMSKSSYSEPDCLPLLTYESENNRETDTCVTEVKSCDDQIVSIDSEYQINRSPPTPDLRKAELDSNDISEGIRVLIVQKDYLSAGVIQLSKEDDVETDQKLWLVKLDGDRKYQDIIISEWQLLEQGVREVIPTSINQLTPGTRVCANWSYQLPMNLYPGTISNRKLKTDSNKVPIDFDDGDHKDIFLEQVRLLPENFPNIHEFMKDSKLTDSNFYSSDRKIRSRKPTSSKQSETDMTDTSIGVAQKSQIKRSCGRPRCLTPKQKKQIVNWKLIKTVKSDLECFTLVRNVDDVAVGAGDNVQLLSYSKSSYVANIVNIIARHQSSIMEIELNWYYILSDILDNSDLIKKLKKSKLSKFIIFKTSHSDINDVYSVLGKIDVVTFDSFKSKYLSTDPRIEPPPHLYILAGLYNQNKPKVEEIDESIKSYIYANED